MGILGTATDQMLTAAYLGTRHPEMPEEELMASRPQLKALVELTELLGKVLMQILLVASYFTFPGIREDRDSILGNLNHLRVGT